jgi:hypothetical protein
MRTLSMVIRTQGELDRSFSRYAGMLVAMSALDCSVRCDPAYTKSTPHLAGPAVAGFEHAGVK